MCALVTLVVLVGAPPVLLTHFIGNPTSGLAHFSIAKPLTDAAVKDNLAIIIWIAWAQLVACVLAEFAGAARGVRLPRRIPLTLGFQQKLARQLVVTVLAFLAVGPVVGAVAGTGATVPVATVSLVVPVEAAAPTADAAPDSVLVKPGDDLAQLARTYLGSANRWPEIWELNEGSAEPASAHFTDPSLIRPGWTLRLPTAPADRASTSTSYVEVVVKPHDSMWSIAQAHLGSGKRWPEIWKANQGRTQSDGRIITDPAKVRPGWTLRVPSGDPGAIENPTPPPTTSTPAPAPPRSADPAQTAEPAAPATAAGSSAPTPTPTPSATEPSASAARTATADNASHANDAHEASEQDARLTHMGLGLSAVAAAAVVGAIGRRRVLQQRRRRAGRRIAMPDQQLRDAELELRVAENGEAVRLLDRAARTLMLTCEKTGETFPPVAVVRLFNRGVELLLSEPAPAIEPFIAAGSRMWRFDSATAGHLLASNEEITAADVPFPFPLLVTIGIDERGPVLVNLETAGALTVIGDPAATLPVLHAAATELSTGVLAEMATVQLIGVADGLAPRTECGRVTAHEDLATGLIEPGRFHADMTRELAASGFATMHEARTRGQAELTWPSHAVVLAGPLTDAIREQVIASGVATPGAGTGVITSATSEGQALPGWMLRPAARLRLELAPFGLTVQPQQLTPADLAHVEGLLAVSGDLNDVPARDPGWDAAAAISNALASSAVLCTATDMPPSGIGREAALIIDPLLRAEHSATPMIRILGSVAITGARGEQPRERLTKVTEVAAYLALHRDANRESVTEAVWPVKRIAANYRQHVMSSLRRWLGTADDGDPYLGLYTLHEDVRCDWTEFETLAKKGFAAGVDGLPALEAALALVRDRPFAGVRSGTYAWADALVQEDIIPAICDVADAVATIRLAAGDPAGARAAAAKGLLVEPCSEVLLCLALRAAHLRGDRDDIDELVARVDKIQDELDDNDEDTIELLAVVRLDHAHAGAHHDGLDGQRDRLATPGGRAPSRVRHAALNELPNFKKNR